MYECAWKRLYAGIHKYYSPDLTVVPKMNACECVCVYNATHKRKLKFPQRQLMRCVYAFNPFQIAIRARCAPFYGEIEQKPSADQQFNSSECVDENHPKFPPSLSIASDVVIYFGWIIRKMKSQFKQRDRTEKLKHVLFIIHYVYILLYYPSLQCDLSGPKFILAQADRNMRRVFSPKINESGCHVSVCYILSDFILKFVSSFLIRFIRFIRLFEWDGIRKVA